MSPDDSINIQRNPLSIVLPYPLHIAIDGGQDAGFLGIDSVDAIESVGYSLAAIGGQGVREGRSDDFHTHSFFYSNTIGVLGLLYSYSE